jgi:ribosomal protein S18 acetylase RimI-like enzyme
MPTPDTLERELTLRTAAVRYDDLRLRDSLAATAEEMSNESSTPQVGRDLGPAPLSKQEALEMLSLSEVIIRKAGYGRQLGVRSARVAGASWSQIGDAVGTSKQSAWEAHMRWIDEQSQPQLSRLSGHEGHARDALAGNFEGQPMKALRPSPEEGPSVLAEILQDLPVFWGDRDMRALHQPVWLRQFASDAVIVREDHVLLGYLLGTVTTHGLAYVHLIATRRDRRRCGLGRLLYDAFLDNARRQGARRVEAITTTTNTGSIALHQRLGFSADVVPDYAGPGQLRILFRLTLLPESH